MIFNVKSINTVYIAGKEVDGMKRPREPPTGGNRMNIGRILPTEAAAILNVSPQFVRVAMQQGKLPIGTAVQMSSIWTYHISEKLLADYSGKHHVELHTESQPCRKERENHMVRCNRNSVIHGLLEQYRHIRHVPAKGQALCEC